MNHDIQKTLSATYVIHVHYTNSLDSVDFAMRHQARPTMS